MTRSIRADLTVGIVFGLAVSAIAWALLLDPHPIGASGVLTLGLAVSVSALWTAGRGRARPTYAFVVAALLVSGPAWSCVVAAACTLAERSWRPHRRFAALNGWMFRTAHGMLAGAFAALTFVALDGPVAAADGWNGLAVPVVAHALTFALVGALVIELTRRVLGSRAGRVPRARAVAGSVGSLAAGALVGSLASLAIAAPSGRALSIVAVGLLAVHSARKLHAERRDAIRDHGRSIESVRLSIVRSLTRTMELRDPSTQDHLRRVHRLCIGVARSLDLSEDEIEILSTAALLHDIGKISVPDRILGKPGRLTSEETETVRLHTETGANLLQGLPFPSALTAIVRYHHERWDGEGYPDGLAGEEIPQGARLLAVVDCYDALTSDRPYRKALSHREATAFLHEKSGSMFDPDLVDALIEYLETRDLSRPLAVDSPDPKHEVDDAPTATGDPSALGSLAIAQRELETFYDISRAMGYGLNLDEFLTLAGCRLASLVPYRSLVVYLLDEPGALLRASFAMGDAAEKLKLMSVPVGERVSGWAAAELTAVIGRDHLTATGRDGSRSDLEDWAEDDEMACLRASLAAPMVAESGPVGVLTLYDEIDRGFTATDRRLLVRVAGYVAQAVALEGTGLGPSCTSLTDPLTGVPNARFLWLESAHRMARPEAEFGLLAFRVGGFERTSEGGGNEASDRLLCRIARRFARCARRSETLVRFGHDLFLMLTPMHDPGELVERWHELADDVERPLADQRDGALHQIRLTAAHASYPDDGLGLDVLLETLDDRLAMAARRGRTVIPFRAPSRTSSAG